MKTNGRNTITLILLLTMLVIVTTVFGIAVTFGGAAEEPDAVVIYRQNRLAWQGMEVNGGIADLKLFGEPEPGETTPLIHPLSKDTYRLRLKNEVAGAVGYSLYFYIDNPNEIPLQFDITRTAEMKDTAVIPKDLQGKQMLTSCSGILGGRSIKNIEIPWQWVSESDIKDTEFGNRAVTEDLTYTVKMLLVIEDNNSYSTAGREPGYGIAGESEVRFLHRAYIKGYPGGNFRPDDNISRAEISAILSRILANYNEDNLTDTATDFVDVKPKDWYAKYIARLEDSNIINGYDDGLFRPENPITRAEFATVCVRFFERRTAAIKASDSSFSDIAGEHWAKDYIDKAAKQGFITGYPDGTFKPDNYITRAEAVTVVNRMLSRYPDKNYIDENRDELIIFADVTDREYWAYYEIYESASEHHTRLNKQTESWISIK